MYICLSLAITVQLMYLEGASANGKTLNTDPPTFFLRKKLSFEEIRGPQTGMLSGCKSRRAQGAFKNSMIHILQFTLPIAFRCVLHRWENQEIRCQKLFIRLYDRITSRVIKLLSNPKDHRVLIVVSTAS